MFFYGTTFCRAQLEDILMQFDAVQTDNKIQLIFTIKAGNTCNGIQIYRSTDSLTFVEIGDIQGICGSSGRDESYSFTDNSPVGNKMNYYRLQLGTLGYSFIAKLFFIQPDGNKALLFPNPLTGETIITFLNTSREQVMLSVFNSGGISIYNSSPTKENKFWLNKEDYSPGLYFFNIISDGRPIFNGKFTVL
jgi:hypothetical protein